MKSVFGSHSFLAKIYKHVNLPIYKTYEFSFFRCVNVENWVYGKTISKLHSSNLRVNNNSGRYSKLFPGEKISYWADSKATALTEIKKHGGNKNYLTFNAYDDASSFIPTLDVEDQLVIIDGREVEFYKILLKIENDEELTSKDKEVIEAIRQEEPDCLAYKSVAKEDGLNFLFFEKGFKKLALRDVKFYYGELKSKNSNWVACAISSDYSPVLKNYGMYFEAIAKVNFDHNYINTEEYIERNKNRDMFFKHLHEHQNE